MSTERERERERERKNKVVYTPPSHGGVGGSGIAKKNSNFVLFMDGQTDPHGKF